MIGEFRGRPSFFAPIDEGEVAHLISAVSPHNIELLASAANFHALENQGAELRLEVYLGPEGTGPRLTDLGTRRVATVEGMQRIGSMRIRSLADGERSHPPVEGKPPVPVQETGIRYIVLATESADGSYPIDRHLSPYWKLRQTVENRYPTHYDFLRQVLLSRREKHLQAHVIPRVDAIPGGPHIDRAVEPLPTVPAVALIGLHWLEVGGAERWAIETIEIARRAGLLPIVITDRESSHPWIVRAELEGCVVITLTHPTGDDDSSQNLLRALLENVSLRGVFIHHNQWLYDRLPWLRENQPGLPVVDSLHIIEYAGGGYPAISAHFDNYIDVHHVISPQLAEWLADVQAVDPWKIALAPLIELTSTHSTSDFSTRSNDEEFVVSFIGRFVRQKRPYLFLSLVKELTRALPVPVRAIMQGGGDLDRAIRRQIETMGLRDVVELRPHDADVDQTVRDSDVLVITSQNEGLTLTTLEAVGGGIPVVSSDVGSQRTIIAGSALVPRDPRDFIPRATAVIERLARDEGFRLATWQDQLARAREFSKLPSAGRFAEEMIRSWM